MAKLSKYETYRVTITRPQGVLVEHVKNTIKQALIGYGDMAKVELVRKGEEAPAKPFWKFW